MAANVFANKTYLSSISDAQTQQSLSLSQLWAMGVRGFEIQTQGATVQGDEPEEAEGRTLESEGIVAAGQQLSITFGEAFEELTKLLMTSTDASGNPTECLFLICTYSAFNDGYNPYVFVSNLFNYLDKVCNEEINGLKTDNFEQIGTATTVGDLKGKIVPRDVELLKNILKIIYMAFKTEEIRPWEVPRGMYGSVMLVKTISIIMVRSLQACQTH